MLGAQGGRAAGSPAQASASFLVDRVDYILTHLGAGLETETTDFFCASVILRPRLLAPRLACGPIRLGRRVSESLLRSVMDRVGQPGCLGVMRMTFYLFFFPWDSLLGSGWGFPHAWEGLSFQ